MWAPNVNIFRDPRWGRGQETPGEDPIINGEYGVAFVSGMQGSAEGKYLRAAACLKHYAAYSEETGRGGFPAVVTAQDMEDTFLPAFEAGVERGHAAVRHASAHKQRRALVLELPAPGRGKGWKRRRRSRLLPTRR